MQIAIVCLRERGMIRGGVRHPHGAATYLASAFTADQLREMIAEPALTVLVGQPLTPELIGKLEAERAAEKTIVREPPEAKTPGRKSAA